MDNKLLSNKFYKRCREYFAVMSNGVVYGCQADHNARDPNAWERCKAFDVLTEVANAG